MGFFGEGLPHCKRCGREIGGDEQVCPHCRFNPRDKGLQVSLWLFVVVVSLIILMMLFPVYGPPLIRIAAVAFALTILSFFVAFLATPYRFGRLFLWP